MEEPARARSSLVSGKSANHTAKGFRTMKMATRSMKETGKKENSMEKVSLQIQKVKLKMAFGKMEKELNG